MLHSWSPCPLSFSWFFKNRSQLMFPTCASLMPPTVPDRASACTVGDLALNQNLPGRSTPVHVGTRVGRVPAGRSYAPTLNSAADSPSFLPCESTTNSL